MMKEMRSANRCIRSLIKNSTGLGDGIPAILADLRRVYRFSDVGRINADRIAECYAGFEEWLNRLVVSRPMPPGIAALYFGLYDTSEGIVLHVSGSVDWDRKNPDWACRNDWAPDGGSILPAIFRDISMLFSLHNLTGYYLALALLIVMIKQYVAHSVISLLDDERQSLCIACGFDDGCLYSLGELLDDGLLPPEGAGIWKPK